MGQRQAGKLLAKGRPHFTSLADHLRAVEAAGDAVFAEVASGVLGGLGLPQDPWRRRFELGLRWACRLHDLGKANDYFQKVLMGKADGTTQPVRHELISGLLLARGQLGVREALAEQLAAEDDQADRLLDSITGAVCGHHLKLDKAWRRAAQALADRGAPASTTLLLDASELEAVLPPGASRQQVVLSAYPLDEEEHSLSDLRVEFLKANRRWQTWLDQHDEWRRFAAALRALLMAADAAGSARASQDQSMEEWIGRALSQTLEPGECRRVATAGLPTGKLRPFQQEAAQSEAPVTVVQAGCGSGKTVAAYLWAENHAVGRKLFFCYPTTGTTTEGYSDYLARSDLLTDLMHSRAEVDLESIQSTPEDSDTESLLRTDSLRSWAPVITACTVDTVASLARNCRRGLYSSPALLNAAFVFDEVHSYDRRLFEAMILLMQALPGAHFLLLSASVQPARRRLLRDRFPGAEWVRGPSDWEELPRYRLRRSERDECLKKVAAACERGKKVLWISNTVARARDLAEAGCPVMPVVYHSRFRYADRAAIHRRVVDAFSGSGALVASTTQVAEMSLDIDSDLLVTDLAPIPALIQRLGRLNRRATSAKPAPPRTALIVEPPRPNPYASEELDNARRWVEALAGRDVSQADLRETWHRLDPGGAASLEHGSEWLDTGWISLPGQVREGGFTVRAILGRDEAACRVDSKAIIRSEIPVLARREVRLSGLRRLRGRPIIPEDTFEYSEERGFRWKR